MRSTWPAVAALALGPAVLPAQAQAQATGTTTTPSGTIAIQLVSIGGKTVGSSPRPISLDDCTEPTATIKFHARDVPTAKETLDLYIGDNCNQTNRTTADANCAFVDTFPINDSKELDMLVDAADTTCPADGEPTFWFLAVDSSHGGEDVAMNFGTLKVKFDTKVPAAPDNVEGGAGERQIPISWETDEKENARFIVYIDDQATSGDDGSDGGTSSDGKCSSSRLVAGSAAKDIPKSIPTQVIEEGTATGLDLDAKDIDGNLAAVGVVAVDIAGNESTLSELACVEVVPTEGFWEHYQKAGGTADTGCAVHAQPGGVARGEARGALVLALGLLALARARRRRS